MTRNHKCVALLTALGLLASAQAGAADLPTMDEVLAQTAVARNWIDGKLDDYHMPPVTYTGEPIVLHFTSHIPATSATVKKVDRPGFALLEKLTQGKIKVEMRHGATVHKVSEGFSALRSGLSDFTNCFTTYDPKSFNLPHAMSLPGVFDTAEIATYAGQELAPKYFVSEFAKHGVDLAYMRATTEYVYFSKEPIARLEDLQGKKIRSSGGTHAAVQAALGGVPTSVPSPQVYTSLQRGVIDIVSLTDAIVGVFKIYELAKYRTFINLSRVNLEKCMRPAWYEALPADLRTIVSRFMPVLAMAESQITYRVAGAEAIEKFKAAGMQFNSVPEAEQERWRAKVQPIIDEYVTEMEGKGLPVRDLLADIERLNKQYGGKSGNDLTMLAILEPHQVLSTQH
jgi:TRAP-type C4-dicarboxylate transport system substrate-binding protein